MIGVLYSCLDVQLTWLPPHSGLCQLKSHTITTSVCGSRRNSFCTSLLIIRGLLRSSFKFLFLGPLQKRKCGIYIDTIISFLLADMRCHRRNIRRVCLQLRDYPPL
jgi:hypothetical protein